jgi:hypothetical protein
MQKEKKKRQPNKLGETKTLREAHKEYANEVPEGTFFDVEYKVYRQACEMFNKMIVDKILLKAEEFVVPYRLGTIRIKKKKMSFKEKSKLKVDWKTTKEVGKVVYHMNDHTDNYRYGWKWDKTNAIVKNKKYYSFEATRSNKRRLASLLKDRFSGVDYFE